jgi:peptide chain release factor 3
MGYDFQGIYNLWEQNINLFSGDNRKTQKKKQSLSLMYKIQNWKNHRTKPADTLREELELIDEVYPKFDRQDYLDGKLQPVFWFRIE